MIKELVSHWTWGMPAAAAAVAEAVRVRMVVSFMVGKEMSNVTVAGVHLGSPRCLHDL